MIKRLIYYLKIWVMMSKNAYIVWLSKRGLFFIFLLGKVMRYTFYFSFLYYLVDASGGLAGFSGQEVLFFTATYVMVDTLSQFFFRSVYTFRPLVVSGDFDLTLLKPMNPLFRVLAGGPDLIDLITIPPLLYITYLIGSQLNPTTAEVVLYLALVINGIIISMAFHIFVLALGVITLEIDHTIMVFRDLTSMGRFPVDIYKEPLRSFLTFVVPVGVMITFPAKAFLGILTPFGAVFTIVFAAIFLMSSIRFWNFALKKYTSASS